MEFQEMVMEDTMFLDDPREWDNLIPISPGLEVANNK